MRETNNYHRRWQQVRGKKLAHWGVLTLNDLPKTNFKYSQLIAQLQAEYKDANESSRDKPK